MSSSEFVAIHLNKQTGKPDPNMKMQCVIRVTHICLRFVLSCCEIQVFSWVCNFFVMGAGKDWCEKKEEIAWKFGMGVRGMVKITGYNKGELQCRQ